MGNRRFPAKETQAIEAKYTDTNSEEIHYRSGNRTRACYPFPSGNEAFVKPHAQLHRLLVAPRRGDRLLGYQTPTQKKALRKSGRPVLPSHKLGAHSGNFEKWRL